MSRRALGPKKAMRVFHSGRGMHPKNHRPLVMRGGMRL